MNCATFLSRRFFPECFFHGHVDLRREERWIEVNGPGSSGKQNKPAEQLLEVKEVCQDCNRTIRSGYFTREQVEKKKCSIG